MAAIPPHAFARRLRQLDRGAFGAFVAALWAASGWETRVEDGVVIAERGDERQRLAIAPPRPLLGWWHSEIVPDDADAIVRAGRSDHSLPGRQSAAAAGQIPIVDATELRERLLFGLDPGAADRLCAEHLGVLTRNGRWGSGGPLPGGIRVSGATGSHARGRTVLVGAVLLGIVLLVIGPTTLFSAAPLEVGETPGDPTGQADAPVPEPTCERSPGEVATSVGGALALPEEGTSGTQVLWEFTDPELRETRQYRSFRGFYAAPQFDPLRRADEVVLQGVVRDGDRAQAFVTAPTDDGPTTYVFDLRERDRIGDDPGSEAGDGEECWRIGSVALSSSD